MIVQQYNNMAEVKTVSKAKAKELKIQLTLEILGTVFAFIPFLENFTPKIEGLDAILQIVDVANNTALAIQGIISDP